MPRGVKTGTKRGFYKRHSKPRLRKLARDILAGNIDPEAVAQAFESTNRLADLLIASQLREGREFNAKRLARAVEGLATLQKPPRKPKPIPLSMAKAALRHLPKEHGGKGEAIHKALRVEFPYTDHPRVRAYHRQLEKDYGKRSKGRLEQELDDRWPERTRGRHPEMERAIKERLSGYGVPLEVWRSVKRRRSSQQP
jgi:hypothetical protein